MEVNKKVLLGLVVVAIVLAALYLFQSAAPTVSAQGFSSIKVKPDLTSVVINIQTKDVSASVAQEKNKKINDLVLEKLAAAGINSDNVSVGSYSIYPDYDYSAGNKLKGYIVSQDLNVKVAEFSSVGKVIDAAIAGGGVVSYVNAELSVEKQNSYKADALAMASKDARVKAEATASGLGKKLGSLVSVQSQDFNYPGPRPYYAKADGTSDSTAASEVKQAISDVSPQEIEVTASVTVEYKLSRF